jgi:hypothetical protein
VTRKIAVTGYARAAAAALAAATLAAAVGSASTPTRVELPPGGRLALTPRETSWAAGDRLPPRGREPGQRLGLRTSVWLGMMEVEGGWADFRGQRIGGGSYDLCYALQPRRKDHVGLDAIRDFAVLVPATPQRAEACAGQWLNASRGVAGTGHPAVLALLSADEFAQSRIGQPDWVVAWLAVAGETIGFVVVGQAQPLAEAF